jgi:hypothetical protein
MKKLKKEEDRKIRLSISMKPELFELIDNDTTNRSKYIEFAMLKYFSKCGINISKIKL